MTWKPSISESKGRHEVHHGTAMILELSDSTSVERASYEIQAQHCKIRVIGTAEHNGNTYDIHECYADSASDEYIYFATVHGTV